MSDNSRKLDMAKVIECQGCGTLGEIVMRECDYISYVDYILHSQDSRYTKMNNFELFFPYLGMREKRLLVDGICESCAESFEKFCKQRSHADIERGDV